MPTSFTAPDHTAPPPAGYQPPPVVDLAFPPSPSPAEGADAAGRAWVALVDAGRIGVAPPPPQIDSHADLRCASLAAIVGGPRPRIW